MGELNKYVKSLIMIDDGTVQQQPVKQLQVPQEFDEPSSLAPPACLPSTDARCHYEGGELPSPPAGRLDFGLYMTVVTYLLL